MANPTVAKFEGGKKVKVAAVQAEPVWNDLKGGVAKTIKLIQEAAANGTNVMGFPEVWIPGYPWSIWCQSVVDNIEFMDEYFRNSLERESPEMDEIRAAVKEAGIFVVLGYSERYKGTLYLAQSFINPNGDIVLHRRKIKPTHVERGYWGDGQGESLISVAKSEFGNIGGLNCWEHTQTLLRYYEYEQDVDIHIASWPAIFEGPEMGNSITGTMNQRLTQIMAMEGACFTAICSQIITAKGAEACGISKWSYAQVPGGGFSQIFGPKGEALCEAPDAGVETILYADVDLHDKLMAKQSLDVVGHYSRPDQLSLRVNKNAATCVHYADLEGVKKE